MCECDLTAQAGYMFQYNVSHSDEYRITNCCLCSARFFFIIIIITVVIITVLSVFIFPVPGTHFLGLCLLTPGF